MRRHDLVVVGGGTAGLVSSLIAAGAGARVALVERARTGGECLWTGCVPSKSLLAAADLAQRMREAPSVGLPAVDPQVDFARVIAHVRQARQRIEPHDSPERLRRDGVEVIEAQARFDGPRRIVAGDHVLEPRSVIIATGSRPVVPPVGGIDRARPLDNETVWHLDGLPRRLAVLGGGPVGCELAQAFARLGSAVTLVEQGPRLLPGEEPRASALVAERLRREGITVRVETAGVEVRLDGGVRRLTTQGPGGASDVEVDELLVAVGRRAATGALCLEAAGVATEDSGAIRVDDRLRTSVEGVYAAGDVTGQMPFTHVAAQHARIAVPNALFGARSTVSYRAVPRVTFTDPEVASVGMTESRARERWGRRTTVVDYAYRDLDRAITASECEGFAMLVGDARGRLAGATVAGPAAGESIAELAAWIRQRGKVADVSRTVHAYPTMSEGPARAADDYLRRRLARPPVQTAARAVLAARRLLAPH